MSTSEQLDFPELLLKIPWQLALDMSAKYRKYIRVLRLKEQFQKSEKERLRSQVYSVLSDVEFHKVSWANLHQFNSSFFLGPVGQSPFSTNRGFYYESVTRD